MMTPKTKWELQEKKIAERIRYKLPPDKRKAYEYQITKIKSNPYIGKMKKGDLKGIRVLNFHYKGSTECVAYRVDTKNYIIALLYYGTHENFYKKLKRLRKALGL